jgi:hypothetical protein
MRSKFNKLLCKMFGHKWDNKNNYDQHCLREGCHVYRVLMRDIYEKVGENPWHWRIMDIDKLCNFLKKTK